MSYQNQPTKSGGPASGAANPHENGVAEGAKVLTDWLRGLAPDERPDVSDLAALLDRGADGIRRALRADDASVSGLLFSLTMLRLLCASPSFDKHASTDEVLREDRRALDPWLRAVATRLRRTAPEIRGTDLVQRAKGEAACLQAEASARGERLGRSAALDRVAKARGEANWHVLRPKLEAESVARNAADAEAWREAGRLTGWAEVARDPSPGRVFEGPCLYHADQDRVWPLGDWEGAVRDLGYTSAREAIEEADPGLLRP